MQRIVKAVMVVLNVLVILGCIVFIDSEYRHRRKHFPDGHCSPLAYLEGGKLVDSLYSPYAYIRFSFGTLPVIWLIIISSLLSEILRKETNDGNLTKESCTIVLIIWGFILSYIGWLVETITVTFFT